jgi:hypothetical protein
MGSDSTASRLASQPGDATHSIAAGAGVSAADQNAGLGGGEADSPIRGDARGISPAMLESRAIAEGQASGAARTVQFSHSDATAEKQAVEEGAGATPGGGAVGDRAQMKEGLAGAAESIVNVRITASAAEEDQLAESRKPSGDEPTSKADAINEALRVAGAAGAIDIPKINGSPAAQGGEPASGSASSNPPGTHLQNPSLIHRAPRTPWQSNRPASGKSSIVGIRREKAMSLQNTDTAGMEAFARQNPADVPSLSSFKGTITAATPSMLRATRVNAQRAKDMTAGAGRNSDGKPVDAATTDPESKPESSSRPEFAPIVIRGEATLGHDAAFAKTIGLQKGAVDSVATPSTSSGSDLLAPGTPPAAQPIHLAGPMTAQSLSPAPSARASAGAAFERMDSAAGPQVIENTPQRLAVGVHSTGLGWVEIRASSAAGQVSATLTSSAESHGAIAGQLSTVREYLAGQHVQIDTLASERFSSSGNGSSSHEHSRNENAQQARSIERGGTQNATPIEADAERLSYINVRVCGTDRRKGFHADISKYHCGRGHGGSTSGRFRDTVRHRLVFFLEQYGDGFRE